MGGLGSSRWINYSPRYEVGECLKFDIQDLKQILTTRISYSNTYGWPGGSQITVNIDPLNAPKSNFKVRRCSSIEMVYKRGRESISQQVIVEVLAQQLGGWRLWLRCPKCCRRCRYLYMPPTNKHSSQIFLCRLCHNLTYRSCNDSHKNDAFLRMIGGRCGIGNILEVSRLIRELF